MAGNLIDPSNPNLGGNPTVTKTRVTAGEYIIGNNSNNIVGDLTALWKRMKTVFAKRA
jgi:hypothetical protein